MIFFYEKERDTQQGHVADKISAEGLHSKDASLYEKLMQLN